MYRSQKPTDKIGTKSKPLANKIQSKKSTIGKAVTNNNNLTYPLHKKPINRAQKPKILKSISNDTLFAGSDTDEKKPSLGFIDFLNKQATIIQRWYRRKKLRLAQLKVELLIEEVPPKNLHLEINQSNSIPEDLVIKRRRERAEKAKMDLIQELKMESSVVQDTSSELKTTHSPKQENNFIVDRLNELNSKHAEKRHLNIPNDGSSQIPRTSQKELLDSLTKVENKSVEIESDPLENNGDIKFSQEIDVQLDLEIGKAEEVNDILTAVNSYYSKYNKEDPLSRSEVEREPIYEDDFDVYDPGESLTMPEFKSVAYENYTISNNQVIQEPLDNHQLQSSNSSVDENPKDNVPQNGKNMEETSAIMNIPTTSTKKDSPKLTADRPIIRGVTPTMDQTQTRTNKIMDHRQASPVQISSNIFQPISSSPQFSYHKSVDNSKPPKMYTSSIDPQDKQANDRVNRIMDLLKSVDEPDISRNQPIAKDNLKEASETHSTAIVFEGVKAKMMSQQMEIETKTKMIDSLKNELIKYKEMNKEELNQHQKNLKSQLNLQRKEYETIVKRHLSFIDKVLNEKEEISKKSSELTSQVKNLEKMYQDKIQHIEDQQARELKQQRELWQSAEKIKRDKWIQERTKIIKDQTVQGLEPEIQKLIAQHKVQLRQLEDQYRDSMTKEKSNLMEQYQRQIESVREAHIVERQKACEEEREFARQRYSKQLEREEMEFQQQKRKLMMEFDDEKHRLNENHKDTIKQEQLIHKRAIDTLRKEIDQERSLKDSMLDELRRKQANEMSKLRETLQIEKEEWQSNYMNKIEAQIRVKEKAFKEQLIKERDAEIEMVIRRLESETDSNSSDATRRYRMDIERIKSETAEEIKQLRDQHSMALDKLLVCQSKLTEFQNSQRESQKEILKFQHSIIAKESLIKKQKEDLKRLTGDEETLLARIRVEFEEDLEAKDAQIKYLQDKINNLQCQFDHSKESFEMKLQESIKDKDNTMTEVEKQVTLVLKSRDEMIAKLKSQLDEQIHRGDSLEALIEKQRHELLGSL